MQTISGRPRRTRPALSALVIVVALATSACLGPNQVEVRSSLNQDRTEHALRRSDVPSGSALVTIRAGGGISLAHRYVDEAPDT